MINILKKDDGTILADEFRCRKRHSGVLSHQKMPPLHQPPHPQHDQNPEGGSKGIVNHVVELKQSAEAHQYFV